MRSYILKRLGLMVITFCIITFLTFYIIKLLPNDYRMPIGTNPDYWNNLVRSEGWDLPIMDQFFRWLHNIFVKGTFGYSTSEQRDSWLVIRDRIPVTLQLNIWPYLISVPVGIAFGILAALKKNKWQDHTISIGVIIFISIPGFVLAVLVQYIFVYQLGWFNSPFVLSPSEAQGNLWGDIMSRVLPTFVLAIGAIASWTRLLRAELTEVLTSEFMLLARSKGLSRGEATLRHGLRNAFVPFAPSIISGFVGLLSGSFIIEQAFRVPGVGKIYLSSFSNRDYNLLMLVIIFYTSIGLLTAIVGDISYGFIDPRIKMGAGKK